MCLGEPLEGRSRSFIQKLYRFLPATNEEAMPFHRCVFQIFFFNRSRLRRRLIILFLAAAFNDIDMIRSLPMESEFHPIPGFPTICIETTCRCHYLAFADSAALETFSSLLRNQVDTTVQIQGREENEISNAFLLQKIQQMSESAITTDERKKWDTVISSNKARQRVILNTRRMAFDVEGFMSVDSLSTEQVVGAFVQKLLSRVLSFSLKELEESPESFIRFIDDTSRLRKVPLSHLDLNGKDAFCFFVNLYHCLLQHALLLSPIGPLSKVRWYYFAVRF